MHGSGCKNCPAFAKCTETYRGPGCDALRHNYGIDSDPQTNADRIRDMSTEELAAIFVHATADGCPPEMDWDCAKDGYGWDACEACWAKWLQQPAEED